MASAHNDRNDGFWTMLFLCVLALLVWNVAKPYAHFASLTSSYYQARAIETITGVLPLVETPRITEDRKRIARALNRGPHNLGFDSVSDAKRSTQHFFLALVTFVYVLWALRLWKYRPHSFEGMLTLDALDVFISRFYYPSRSVVGRKLHLRHPLKDKSRRFARKPWEWAVEIGALRRNGAAVALTYRDHSVNLIRPKPSELREFTFHEPIAKEVLTRQLGTRLRQPQDLLTLPPEYIAMAVALLADTVPSFADRFGGPDYWLKQYSTGFWDLKALKRGVPPSELPPVNRHNLDITGCVAALTWALDQAKTRELLSTSAYANSLMVHLMKRSKLATAKFVWLKVLNRTLFYALNNVGRPRRVYIEGHAPMVHAEYEEVCGAPQGAPYLNHSIEAIKQTLLANKWLPMR